jgi:hypothetical protein
VSYVLSCVLRAPRCSVKYAVLAGLLAVCLPVWAAEPELTPALVTHQGFDEKASALLRPDLPFGVISEERRLTLIDRATARPLRRIDFPQPIRAVVVARDGTTLLVTTQEESELAGGPGSVWRVSAHDGVAMRVPSAFGGSWVDVTDATDGWFVLSTQSPHQNRLCLLKGATPPPAGLDIECQPAFVAPGTLPHAAAVAVDAPRERAVAAMVNVSDATVTLMQLSTRGAAALPLGRFEATTLGLKPIRLLLSAEGTRLHVLVWTTSKGSPATSSGLWLQSWKLDGSTARLEASRELPPRTALAGIASAPARLVLLQSGFRRSEPVLRLEVDPATLQDSGEPMPVGRSEGARVIGTNGAGDGLMVQRSSGLLPAQGSQGSDTAPEVSWLAGRRGQWSAVSIHPHGVELARKDEAALSVSTDADRLPVRREPPPASTTIHALHPRWLAATRFDANDDSCCLIVVDRSSGAIRHEVRMPGVTTLDPGLVSTFRVAFSADGRFLVAVSEGDDRRRWLRLQLDDGRILRHEASGGRRAARQLFVTDDGRIVDIGDPRSFVVEPSSEGSTLTSRRIDVEPRQTQLLDGRLVHVLHAGGASLRASSVAEPSAAPLELYHHRTQLKQWTLSPDGQRLAYVEPDGSLKVRPIATVGGTVLRKVDENEDIECLMPDGRSRFFERSGEQLLALIERGGDAERARLPLPAAIRSATWVSYECSPQHRSGFVLAVGHRRLEVWRHGARFSDGFTRLGGISGLLDIPVPCWTVDLTRQGQQIVLSCLHGSHDDVRTFHAFPAAPREAAGLNRLRINEPVFLADDLTAAARLRSAPRDDAMPTVEWFDPAAPNVAARRATPPEAARSVLNMPRVVASSSRRVIAVASAHLSQLAFWHRDRPASVSARWSGGGDLRESEGLHPGQFTADERHYVACVDGRVVAFDVNEGTLTHELDLNRSDAHCFVGAAPRLDEVLVIHDGAVKRLTLTDTASAPTHTLLAGPGSHPRELGFLRDGHTLVSTHDDGFVRFWDTRHGRLRVALFAGSSGWAAVAPDGRFDVSDFDAPLPLSWVLPDRPFEALPIEAFMRDRYEPGLMRSALSNDRLAARPLSRLDRNLPLARIVSVEAAGRGTQAVDVKVRLDYRASGTDVAAGGIAQAQLFRGARVVATRSWSPPVRSAEVMFTGIKLPRRDAGERVRFSVHAFNADRVKGESASFEHVFGRSAGVAAAAGVRRAFVVAIGIDSHADPRWNLRYAARDAALFAQQLPRHLAAPQFDEVVVIQIDATGPYRAAEHGRIKQRIREALRGIASGPYAAGPDDAVFITFSGHGVRSDDAGLMLVMPDASASSPSAPEFRERSIVVDELAEWLRDIDAGSFTLVLDACHAGASVGEAFRAAPLGERGFGQLAFDKGMRLLAASQANEVAVEVASLEHGLLTYVLIREGLEQRRARWNQIDGHGAVAVADWLQFGTSRVSAIAGELAARQKDGAGPADRGTVRIHMATSAARGPAGIQQPVLFDFDSDARLRRRDALLTQP